MAEIRRVQVKADEEIKLLTGLIVDDEFCRRVLEMLKPEHMQVRHARRIIQWVRQYHEKYGKAPGLEIQTLFNVEKKKIDKVEADVIQDFLANLNDQYQQQQGHNWQYQTDLARDYIRRRALEVLSEQVTVLKDKDLAKAEEIVRDFVVTGIKTSQWVFPFIDRKLQQRIISRQHTGPFRLTGALGGLFGYWQRGWLVAFFGPMKRGKTWWLTEVAVQAVVQKLKVVFISLEMSEEDMSKRFLKNATSLPDKAGKMKIPIWDCQSNQDGSCDLPIRTNRKIIPQDSRGFSFFDGQSSYRPCVACKSKGDEHLKHYRIASWFRMIDKKEEFAKHVMKRAEAFAMQYNGGNLALRCYPRNSATVDDIKSDLEGLEVMHNFTPDMIVIDYATIIKMSGHGDKRDQIDEVVKDLAGMVQQRKVIGVTGFQGNRKSLTRRSMQQTDVPDDIRILAHIDQGISLNQLNGEDDGKSERDAMVMRLGAMAIRHGAWPEDECYVLQNLYLGQPAMDVYAVSLGNRWIFEER